VDVLCKKSKEIFGYEEVAELQDLLWTDFEFCSYQSAFCERRLPLDLPGVP